MVGALALFTGDTGDQAAKERMEHAEHSSRRSTSDLAGSNEHKFRGLRKRKQSGNGGVASTERAAGENEWKPTEQSDRMCC